MGEEAQAGEDCSSDGTAARYTQRHGVVAGNPQVLHLDVEAEDQTVPDDHIVLQRRKWWQQRWQP